MINCVLIDGTYLEIQSLKEINDREIATQIKEIDCFRNKLETLEGIEECINLQTLNCSGNWLETLEGLEKCINLQTLNCSNNQLGMPKNKKDYDNYVECLFMSGMGRYGYDRTLFEYECIKGLENCNKLTILDCSYNLLQSLEGLEKCTEAKWIPAIFHFPILDFNIPFNQ